MKRILGAVITSLFLALASSSALASTTWYVNGVNGSDSNNCMSSETACKTIGHAISLAVSGDSIMVSAATYTENLTIRVSLNVIGSGASTTVIDGGHHGSVVVIYTAANVTLSGVTIRNGLARFGGGVVNVGTLRIIASTISDNRVSTSSCISLGCAASGAGIINSGTLTIYNSTIRGNTAYSGPRDAAFGGGIANSGTVTVNNSTFFGNSASGNRDASGGGIVSSGTLTISNSTLTGNTAGGIGSAKGGGISVSLGTMEINNSTLSGNGAPHGGDIYNNGGTATVQNSIVADSNSGGNCDGTIISNGYNLSSDSACAFNGPGDLNNTDPKLGTLGYYGGETQTIPLLSGSPAIDAGNPSGCTDEQGNQLKTDQRGMPRPDPEDTGGCDMGAYERQRD